MDNIVLLVLCLLLGVVLGASGRMPEHAPATVNSFIIHISLPALIAVVLALVLIAIALPLFAPAGSEIWRVSVFEAAMGPSIGGGVVAHRHRLNDSVVSLMVGVGIPLSLFTASVWWWAVLAP